MKLGSIVPMLGESPSNSKTDVGWGDFLDTSSSDTESFFSEDVKCEQNSEYVVSILRISAFLDCC